MEYLPDRIKEKYPHQIAICKRIERIAETIEVNFNPTKHPYWQHGYLVLHGVQVAKILFFKGGFSHIKWYHKQNLYVHYTIIWMLKYNVIVKENLFTHIKLNAKYEAEYHYQQKVAHRKSLPPKKRPKLSYPNYTQFIRFPEELKVIL